MISYFYKITKFCDVGCVICHRLSNGIFGKMWRVMCVLCTISERCILWYDPWFYSRIERFCHDVLLIQTLTAHSNIFINVWFVILWKMHIIYVEFVNIYKLLISFSYFVPLLWCWMQFSAAHRSVAFQPQLMF